jgi:outer membrane beta-barrel protein
MRLVQLESLPTNCSRRARGTAWVAVALAGALLLVPGAGWADEDTAQIEETDLDLPAVQNRKYRVEHELAAGIGTLPTDPYTKGLSLNGAYAWHLSDLWGIEANFSWIVNFTTSLRDKLEGNFSVPDQRFARFKMFGQLGGLFKPLYGKLALLNDRQVYGELFLSLYGVVAQMDGGRRTDTETRGKGQRLAFGASPGFGIRGFISRYFSARLNLNWLIVVAESGEVHTPLFINLQFAFSTRSGS